jgi:hypothetical protein
MPSDRCRNVRDVVTTALTVIGKIGRTLRMRVASCEGCDRPLVLRRRGNRFCSSVCRADVWRAGQDDQRRAA